MSTPRTSTVIVLLALAAGGVGLWAGARMPRLSPDYSAREARVGKPALAVGDYAPSLSLPDRSGQRRALAEWSGRPTLINFWASWCTPCIEEMPMLDRFSRQQAGNGIQVLGIAIDDHVAVERFLRRSPVHYPILLDRVGAQDSSVRFGNVMGVLPYSVLVDATGRVLARKYGSIERSDLDTWAAAAR